ncbi:nanoRNase/pAp phosphatase, hydrolyzes c-di-AMP and oligoRNAs [Haladaptatus litoreus]|uniref:NanoRNase/pAp phosphatase, hydrolyzes c-di-AMP and oligoRNAs n=1 Tax=Haladaptatus litoreus TaxID=553468 RepID=A0A1N6ZB89_9EURY|nr:bifunctional oligoribonuclease/PAP phosphatase NrnA [Haladaptatus litoreus]SIR24085.1 nanoRNase/pAp phosphatase, hydrolyzes c-di-AMP and oligoRNAs [Haladaptatus litoreus]
MTRAQELAEYLAGTESLAIICHDNPDPDCIASALALSAIAEWCGVADTELFYGGMISHQQNRAFVNLLHLNLEHAEEFVRGDFDKVAFVDHATPAGHTELESVEPDIVIDHHSTEAPECDFVDLRDEYGATASILVEYFRELDIKMNVQLGSALLFALHRERIDYIRGPTTHEYEAALYVYGHADLELLERLYGAAFSPSTVDAISEAIRNRVQRGATLATSAGRTTERDALAQAADYLLNVEGVDTVLVFGVVDSAVEMSARSIDPRVHAGNVLQQAFADVGSAGGHADMAGAQIPLGLFADSDADDEELVDFASRRVVHRFFDALHLERGEE